MTQHDDDFTTLPPRRGEETYTAEQIVKAFIDRTKKFPETREALLATGEFADPSLVKDLEQKLDDTRQKLADTKSDLEVARKDSDRLTLEVAQLRKDKATLETKLATVSHNVIDTLGEAVDAKPVLEAWSVGKKYFFNEDEAEAKFAEHKAHNDELGETTTIEVKKHYFFATIDSKGAHKKVADPAKEATAADYAKWLRSREVLRYMRTQA